MSLVAFDFDGTLSESEMTVRLAEQQGVTAAVADITDRAMNDELSYADSLRRRVQLLADLSSMEMTAAFENVSLRPGAGALLETLNAAGVHTAILTGGFHRGVDRALESADTTVDRIIANELVVEDGTLTGDVDGPLIEGTKDDALEALAGELAIDLSATIAVGDGANDLPMLQLAGTAIGFDPHDAVRPHCDHIVTTVPELRTVLREQGIL